MAAEVVYFKEMVSDQNDVEITDNRRKYEELFTDVDLLIQPFLAVLSEQQISLLKEVLLSYRMVILDCLNINYELRDEISKLKRNNANLVFNQTCATCTKHSILEIVILLIL